ncbi:MAG TPA: PfkB family carbohydrate kinase [Solirubrobacterales bacterium]|nr:PfkB family carbohydrate kinase [Solirubrobacterales bacterium]
MTESVNQPTQTGVTVLGNFSVDYVDDGPPTPGGCPVFAAMALHATGHPGRVVARLAREDLALFEPIFDRYGELISPLWTTQTSSFELRYHDGGRRMTVKAVSAPWGEADLEAAAIGTGWVHLAPLLRGDFPLGFLQALTARGHRISLDGQGLVRAPRLGPLRIDDDFDRALLGPVEVLKLGRDEAEALAGGPFDTPTATRLGVAEILVTFGAGGCDLYLDGERHHVPARAIADVQTTGTGDAFMVSYLADRAAGLPPLRAAERASAVVATILEARRTADADPAH